MDSKTKAKELVDKYYHVFNCIAFEKAKECALICVDEIIKENEDMGEQHGIVDELVKNIKYWEECKKEIQKL